MDSGSTHSAPPAARAIVLDLAKAILNLTSIREVALKRPYSIEPLMQPATKIISFMAAAISSSTACWINSFSRYPTSRLRPNTSNTQVGKLVGSLVTRVAIVATNP